LLHHTVEGPGRLLTTGHLPFPPSCCGWQGACRGRLLWLGELRRGPVPGAARCQPRGDAWRSCVSDGPLPWDGWSWCETKTYAVLSVVACIRSGAALVNVRLDVVPLPSSSSSQTVTGCWLGGYPAGRDSRWGGEYNVGRVLSHINIGANVWFRV
jgi:hypothetical protein